MHKLLPILFIAICNNTFAADDYTKAISINHTKSTDGNGGNSASDIVTATHYFKPVAFDASHPYAEAQFIQRTSFLSGFVGDSAYESVSEKSNHFSPRGVGGTFYSGDYFVGFNLQDFALQTREVNTSSRGYDRSTSVKGLSLGYFIHEKTLIYYENSRSAYTSSAFGGATAISNLIDTSNKFVIRSLAQLNENQFLSTEANLRRIDRSNSTNSTNTEYSGAIRFYPNRHSYIGYTLSKRHGDNNGTNGKTSLITLGYNLAKESEILLLNSKFSRSELPNAYNNTTWMLGFGYKF